MLISYYGNPHEHKFRDVRNNMKLAFSCWVCQSQSQIADFGSMAMPNFDTSLNFIPSFYSSSLTQGLVFLSLQLQLCSGCSSFLFSLLQWNLKRLSPPSFSAGPQDFPTLYPILSGQLPTRSVDVKEHQKQGPIPKNKAIGNWAKTSGPAFYERKLEAESGPRWRSCQEPGKWFSSPG